MRRPSGPTGRTVATLADDGEYTIVVPGAKGTVGSDVVEGAADVIRTAHICLLQAELPVPSVERAAPVAADAGVRAILNVAPACRFALATRRLAGPPIVNEHEAVIATRVAASSVQRLGARASHPWKDDPLP